MVKEARFYSKLENNICRCETCPRACVIKPGKHGYCYSRENAGGALISALYGKVAAVAVDPIEKKPLYHFFPGSRILSIGTIGCNLGCKFCQNWHLSRGGAGTREIQPQEIITRSKEGGSVGIAYTYNEPFIWYEYVYDCCKLARSEGLQNVFVTNGTLNPEPFDEILPLIDALNMDLKGDADFYTEMADSTIEPVLRNIRQAADRAHIEITNLLVPGKNDSIAQIQELVDFTASVNPKIPLHFSRYFPNYKLDTPQTDENVMVQAHRIASEKLEFVYIGNMLTEAGQDTVCPKCGHLCIRRTGYFTKVRGVDSKGHCSNCDYDLNIVTSK